MSLSQTNSSQLSQLYDQDFCQWAERTAKLLREGKFADLDLTNLIEEVEDMSKSQQRALLSNLRILIMHLLKYDYQPTRRSPSWRNTIIEHCIRITEALEESPSLKAYLLKNVEKTYQKARKQAAAETELPIETFPAGCPFAVENILDDAWMPDNSGEGLQQ